MSHHFEEDPRTDSQRVVDLDLLDVTITMYSIDDHEGERKARSVFRAERGDWNAVEGTYRQFKAETGFSSFGLPPYEAAGEVWLVTDSISSWSGLLRVAGAAEVFRTAERCELAWVWVHPLRRGRKKEFTHRLASRLRDEYGTLVAHRGDDIEPEPITPAGRRFLNELSRGKP